MRVFILCGGQGTRLREETEFKPKPLVEVGGRPILWHIMQGYASHGFREFVLLLGYKGELIKRYFLDYHTMSRDLTVNLGRHAAVEVHGSEPDVDWRVTLVDTGAKASTGARNARAARHVDGDTFMVTYGDGVSNVDASALLNFHQSHGKLATVTGVHPPARFGDLGVEGDRVAHFAEKPVTEGFINGGWFVFDRRVLEYLSSDDDCALEGGPLERLAREDQLRMYAHEGFWQCMDTLRDVSLLNELWNQGRAPWKIWR